MLIGWHLGENMHNTQVQEFADAVGAGASVIVADPRFSIAAGKAKYYLPIKPGTDIALLLAWMHVLVNEGLYDRDYVAQHGFGFEQFAGHPRRVTPPNGHTPKPASIRNSSATRPARWHATNPPRWSTPAGTSPGTATMRSEAAQSPC